MLCSQRFRERFGKQSRIVLRGQMALNAKCGRGLELAAFAFSPSMSPSIGRSQLRWADSELAVRFNAVRACTK